MCFELELLDRVLVYYSGQTNVVVKSEIADMVKRVTMMEESNHLWSFEGGKVKVFRRDFNYFQLLYTTFLQGLRFTIN